jgi:Lrp/AsnC family transcriptional regulator
MKLDSADRAILNQLQRDASLSMDRLAKLVGLSKTAAWNRVQRLQSEGIITKQVVVLDAEKIGLNETFFIAIKTNQHNEKWLINFNATIHRFPEIVEAHRLSGDTDYLIKVQVASTREFDNLYKKIVASVDLYSVTSSLSMEVLKQNTALPLG